MPNTLIINWLHIIGVVLFPLVATQTVAGEPQYDPKKGFRPAQPNLTAIFLQIASSLEHHGTPLPYLRHMKKEHRRIEAKYQAKFGKPLTSYCPSYMDDVYLDALEKNWDLLAPKLELEKLARESGRQMRLAIEGEDGKGTTLITILNHHQDAVYDEMVESGRRDVDFDVLKAELVRLAEEGEIPFLVECETGLTDTERASFGALLKKPRFTKADFSAVEAFYAGPYDRLTEVGKSQLSARTWAGTRPAEKAPARPSDAQEHAKLFWKGIGGLLEEIEGKELSPEFKANLLQWIGGLPKVVGDAAHSELMVAIMEGTTGR